MLTPNDHTWGINETSHKLDEIEKRGDLSSNSCETGESSIIKFSHSTFQNGPTVQVNGSAQGTCSIAYTSGCVFGGTEARADLWICVAQSIPALYASFRSSSNNLLRYKTRESESLIN